MRTDETETTNPHDPMAAWRASGGAAAAIEAAGAGGDDGLAAGRWSQTAITCGIADEGLAASIYTRGVYNTCGIADEGLTAFGLTRGGIQACADDGLSALMLTVKGITCADDGLTYD